MILRCKSPVTWLAPEVCQERFAPSEYQDKIKAPSSDNELCTETAGGMSRSKSCGRQKSALSLLCQMFASKKFQLTTLFNCASISGVSVDNAFREIFDVRIKSWQSFLDVTHVLGVCFRPYPLPCLHILSRSFAKTCERPSILFNAGQWRYKGRQSQFLRCYRSFKSRQSHIRRDNEGELLGYHSRLWVTFMLTQNMLCLSRDLQ